MSQSKRPEIIVDEIIEDRTHHIQQQLPHGHPYHPSSHPNQPAAPVPQIKRYRRGRYLGKGGFAKVYAFQSLNSGREYACKVIPKASLIKESARRKLMNEIDIHRSITHERVVRFERFFEDKSNVYIILELCQGQSMLELVKRRGALSEVETQFYIWNLLSAIQHLHSSLIIHRDLKLGNLFLDHHGDVKVGDFGLATRLEHVDERKRTVCGTPNYIAPEILDNSHGHSFEVDVWAIGVIMYTLLYGQPPFETESVKTTYKRIKDNHYSFPLPSQKTYKPVSPAAKSLISRILCTEPSRRPTVREMREDVFFSQSPVMDRLGIEVHEKQMGRPHACQALIDEEERREREDERRMKEKLARAEEDGEEEEENEQENTMVKQGDTAQTKPAATEKRPDDTRHKRTISRDSREKEAVQQQQAAARTILGEKVVNDALVRLGKRAESSKSPPATTQSLASRKDRVEALEKEKEEIVSRLKARTVSSASPQLSTASAASPPPPTAPPVAVASPATVTSPQPALTTVTSAAAHHFFHTPATVAKPPTVPSAPIAVPTSPYRRTLSSGQLVVSPSIRRSMSAIPILSAMPTAPISTSSTSSAASPPSSATSTPASTAPAASLAASSSSSRPVLLARVLPSPFAAKGPLIYRFVTNTDSAASTAARPSSSVISPPPTPTTALPLSDSPSAVVSIASADRRTQPSRKAIAGVDSDDEAVEREREADVLRRATDERAIRAELETKLKEEQQKLRAAQNKPLRSTSATTAAATRTAATTASAVITPAENKRVTRGMMKKRKEEDEETKSPPVEEASAEAQPTIVPAGHTRVRSTEMDTLTSSLTAVTLTAPAPSTTPATTAASAAPTLPCVMEESFLATADTSDSSLPPPALYLDKWVDYSSKYGLAYLLSDGRVGVYFNDSTRAVLLGRGKECSRFVYMERKVGGDVAVEYDMDEESSEWPAALVKKVTLIRHFQKYLAQYSKQLHPPAALPSPTASGDSHAHVRRWLRTKHAILFRLSTGQIQVVFNDMTELIIDPAASTDPTSARTSAESDDCDGTVHYTDRSKKRCVCEVQDGRVLSSSGVKDGLEKRLRYVREVLSHMRGRSRQRERERDRREPGGQAVQDEREKAVQVQVQEEAVLDDNHSKKTARPVVSRRG